MSCRIPENSIHDTIMNILMEHGTHEMAQVFEIIYNEAMIAERRQHLGVEAYERNDNRAGHANGFKDKKLKTRVGELNLKIPQVRDSSFYPKSLERGSRSETALLSTVTVHGFFGV